jgi:hypothetical protein
MKNNLSKFAFSIFLLISLVIGVYLVSRVVRYYTNASGDLANIVIDMSLPNNNSNESWRNLAQGGESKDRMLLPVISQTKALKPNYIRIDHVFDYYNDGQLDDMVRDIVATGAKPFIALSYMPLSLSKNGNTTDNPKNWSEWETLTQKLIERVSGRDGLNISGVYYEVWNEPDLFGNFKLNGDKSYLNLYLHSAIGASRAKNVLPYKFGGPATTGYYPNWMNGLLDFTASNNLRLDFLSWHRYSKNLDDFVNDADNARNLLASRNIGNVELIVSEMGPNSENDEVYDNSFGAIHQLAVIAALEDSINKIFAFEVKDGAGDKQFWGRWGLFTNEKFGAIVAKPRVGSIKFLNDFIGGKKLNVTGVGSWVKVMAREMAPNLIRIMVVNYDPSGTHNENVPITLSNLSYPEFTFKRMDFLGGSTTTDVATTSSEWVTSQYFKPNSAAIFEVKAK